MLRCCVPPMLTPARTTGVCDPRLCDAAPSKPPFGACRVLHTVRCGRRSRPSWPGCPRGTGRSPVVRPLPRSRPRQLFAVAVDGDEYVVRRARRGTSCSGSAPANVGGGHAARRRARRRPAARRRLAEPAHADHPAPAGRPLERDARRPPDWSPSCGCCAGSIAAAAARRVPGAPGRRVARPRRRRQRGVGPRRVRAAAPAQPADRGGVRPAPMDPVPCHNNLVAGERAVRRRRGHGWSTSSAAGTTTCSSTWPTSASNCGFSDDVDERLLELYFGRASARRHRPAAADEADERVPRGHVGRRPARRRAARSPTRSTPRSSSAAASAGRPARGRALAGGGRRRCEPSGPATWSRNQSTRCSASRAAGVDVAPGSSAISSSRRRCRRAASSSCTTGRSSGPASSRSPLGGTACRSCGRAATPAGRPRCAPARRRRAAAVTTS